MNIRWTRFIAYQEQTWLDKMTGKVQELNRENFAVRQHLKICRYYIQWKVIINALTYEDTLMVRDEVSTVDSAGWR